MGAWNASCMLTRLPIHAREPVAGILLVQKAAPRATSMPNEIWTPVSPILTGVYDDYGSIEPNGDNWDSLRSRYQSLTNAGKIQFYDGHDPLAEVPSIPELLDITACDPCLRLSWSGYMSQTPMRDSMPQQVTLVLMKQKFYEQALNFSRDLMEFYQKDLIEPMPTWGGAFSSPHPIVKMLHKAGEDFVSVMALNGFLTRMRMQWGPQSGAGNSNTIMSEHQVNFYEAVAEEARLLYKEWRDKNA